MDTLSLNRDAVDTAMVAWFHVNDGLDMEMKERFRLELSNHRLDA